MGQWRPVKPRPFSLVCKLANVCYMLRQFRVAAHVLHFQGLDANNLVFVNEFAGQLMQVVHTAIIDILPALKGRGFLQRSDRSPTRLGEFLASSSGLKLPSIHRLARRAPPLKC